MDEKWEVQPQSDLAELVDRVAHGESVELTLKGKTVARIVPAVSAKDTPPNSEALSELGGGNADAKAAMKKLVSLNFNLELAPGQTIKDLINEGRKY